MAQRRIEEENFIIGKMLQDARESCGVLQSELCDATGLSKNHISAVERGVSKASVKMLLGYCDKIGITPNDVLGYNDIALIPELKKILSTMNKDEQKLVVEIIKIMKSWDKAGRLK